MGFGSLSSWTSCEGNHGFIQKWCRGKIWLFGSYFILLDHDIIHSRSQVIDVSLEILKVVIKTNKNIESKFHTYLPQVNISADISAVHIWIYTFLSWARSVNFIICLKNIELQKYIGFFMEFPCILSLIGYE